MHLLLRTVAAGGGRFVQVPGNISSPFCVIVNQGCGKIGISASKETGWTFVNNEDRQGILESFGRAPLMLAAALRQFPKKMWLFKPSRNRWSIHEIILHLADSEATAYILCRGYIADPGSSALEFDAARWAGSLGYFYQSTREAIEVIPRLRKMTYQLLLTVPEPVWSNTIEHPRHGALNLEKWVHLQERHIPHHLAQMRENYDTWLKLNPPRKPASVSRRSDEPARAVGFLQGAC
jgi:DinB superfamily